MEGSLYVVDAHNYLYRAFFALPPLSTRAGQPTGAVRGLCQMLLKIEREHAPSHLVAVLDAPGPTFRDALFPAYKSERPPMPPDLQSQIALVPRVLGAFGIATLSVPGVEADDVIATLTRLAGARGMKVVLCSSDKDLMQLVGPSVLVLDAVGDRLLGRAEVEAKWGVPPERVGDLLALTGDSVDGVPGVPGIGPKTAAALLAQFGSLEELLARAGEVPGKRGEALRAHAETVRLARRLIALRDDVALPVPLDGLARTPPDRAALDALFTELEFTTLAAQQAQRLAAEPGGAATPGAAGRIDGASPAPRAAAETLAPPAPPVETVRDVAALHALVARITAAGQVGLSLLSDGEAPQRARPLALGIALPDGARAHVPLAAGPEAGLLARAEGALDRAQTLAALAPALADARVAKHVHDSKALMVVLGAHGQTLGGVAGDPLLAAYLLDAARTDHALDRLAAAAALPGIVVAPRATWLGSGRGALDPAALPDAVVGPALAAEAAAALALGPLQARALAEAGLAGLYQDLELPLASVLAAMELRGVLIDVALLRELAQQAAAEIAKLEAEIHTLAGAAFNVASPKQLQAVLYEKLGLPILRRTKTGPSTDAEVLEELAAQHPVPARILEHRALSKLKGTYLDALPALIDPRTGRVHTTFNQAVAATGRLSSSDPNLQNIPIRSPLGRRIRGAFIAPPGRVLLSADYSQIELRVLAHFSRDPAFVAAFAAGDDIHRRTAAEIFAIAPEAVGDEERRVAKAINFGLVFGQTDFGLSQALGISRADARAYIERYFARYAGVKAYLDGVVAEAHRTGEVTTLLGRRRRVPELTAARAQLRAHAERVARNTPIQGSAADLLKLAMLRVDALLAEENRGRAPAERAELLLTVHDELVIELPEGRAPELGARVRAAMESVHPLDVPLKVDVAWGPSWGAAKS